MLFKSLESKPILVKSLMLTIFSSIFLTYSDAAALEHHSQKINSDRLISIPAISVQTSNNKACIDFGTEFQLKVNEIACINSGEVELTLLENIEDLRCPSDRNCYEAGQIEVIVEVLVEGKEPKKLKLIKDASHQNSSSEQIDNYAIELVKAEPYPKSDRPIKASEYKVTLIVSSADNRCHKRQIYVRN